MKLGFKEYVENKLPREDDKKLFRDLLEAYNLGGPEEIKATIQNLIKEI